MNIEPPVIFMINMETREVLFPYMQPLWEQTGEEEGVATTEVSFPEAGPGEWTFCHTWASSCVTARTRPGERIKIAVGDLEFSKNHRKLDEPYEPFTR